MNVKIARIAKIADRAKVAESATIAKIATIATIFLFCPLSNSKLFIAIALKTPDEVFIERFFEYSDCS